MGKENKQPCLSTAFHSVHTGSNNAVKRTLKPDSQPVKHITSTGTLKPDSQPVRHVTSTEKMDISKADMLRRALAAKKRKLEAAQEEDKWRMKFYTCNAKEYQEKYQRNLLLLQEERRQNEVLKRKLANKQCEECATLRRKNEEIKEFFLNKF